MYVVPAVAVEVSLEVSDVVSVEVSITVVPAAASDVVTSEEGSAVVSVSFFLPHAQIDRRIVAERMVASTFLILISLFFYANKTTCAMNMLQYRIIANSTPMPSV